MNLLPKEEKFYDFFLSQVKLISEAAALLLDGARAGNSQLAQAALRIKVLEQKGDDIIHEIYTRLNLTFITPLDPEDLHSLSSHLDDVLDGIEDVAHRLLSYRIDPIPGPIVQICKLIHDCSRELTKAVAALDDMPRIVQHCIEINRIEGEVDDIVRQAIVDLFDHETNPIQVIKLKEIYDYLESTADACEDVADALQNIVVKNG